MSAVCSFRVSLSEEEWGAFLFLKWQTNCSYMDVTSFSGLKLRIFLDDILDIKRYSNELLLTTYILINGKRERKLFIAMSIELDQFEHALRKAHAPQIPPHRPSQKAIKERRYLVLINPFSGQKKSESLWAEEIRRLFHEMRITYEIQRTEYNGHAIQIIQHLDIDNYVGVAVLSGDGIVYECLNGILRRSDFKRALKLPLIHIPTGTSNALAASLAYWSREPFSSRGTFCKELALMCARPYYRSLSLCHVETSENGHLPTFMTTSFGLMADIDLGSERFRHLGMIRLHLEAFIRIAKLPSCAKYPVKISYKAVEDKKLLRNTLVKAKDVVERLGREYFYPKGKIELYDGPGDEPVVEQTIEDAFRGTQLVCDKNGKIPQLSDPIPDDWTTIEGEFVYVCLSSLSHLGSDLPYVPSAQLDGEVFYLTLIDWKALKTRLHVGHLLITIDRGNHLDHSCLHIIPVTACRVEPQTNKAYFAIDGEPCRSGKPFQMFSTNLKATVIGREPR